MPRPRSSSARTRSASAASRRRSSSGGCTETRTAGSRSSPPASSTRSSRPAIKLGARRAIGADPEVPLIVFVGRIQPLKGPDVAIRALADLRRRGIPTRCWSIVGGASGQGGGFETQRAHDLVDELDLHDSVVFVPPQPHHVLSSYYRAADIVIVPSRSESFGLVALEAAACGTPVVASAVGGLLSLVDDGSTGRLIAGRNPSDYGAAMAEILDDPELRTAMSVARSRACVALHVARGRRPAAAAVRRSRRRPRSSAARIHPCSATRSSDGSFG